MILFSHKGTKFQLHFENTGWDCLKHAIVLQCVTKHRDGWLRPETTKECKVTIVTHIPSSGKPRAACTQISCQHLAVRLVKELLADPKTQTQHDFFINHELILTVYAQDRKMGGCGYSPGVSI